MKPLDETERDRAEQYANMLEHTRLIDVIKSVQISFDPNDRSTTVIGDEQLLEQYYEFENLIEECLETAPEPTSQKSKWIIRLEIDAESLLAKNITMDDIHFAISNSHGNDISCIYSDYNSKNLVFRIRLNSSILNKSKKQRGIPDTLDQSDEIYMLRNFQETLLNNIVLRGINGIKNVMLFAAVKIYFIQFIDGLAERSSTFHIVISSVKNITNDNAQTVICCNWQFL